MSSTATQTFRDARDVLLRHRGDHTGAHEEFAWPQLEQFNWALDHFDAAATEHPDRLALWILDEDGTETRRTYAELAQRSGQLANWLHAQGVHRGDRVLIMLANQLELWESTLAAMKLGAVIIPATTLLTESDIADRVQRGNVAHVITNAAETPKFSDVAGHWTRISVGQVAGWLSYADSQHAGLEFAPDSVTHSADPLLLYFTSGTTSQPKLVEHTHFSYPVGHLSTMYWAGIRPGDTHLNISSPGWAKHAYSSIFAPWNAQATVLVVNQSRFDAAHLLDQIVRCEVDTFCAPPTVWRMLIQADLGQWTVPIREAVAAGEPLNPEVIDQVQRAWNLTVRDGYGQTETTVQVGNAAGQEVRPGSMGRAMPGYSVVLEDPSTEQPGEYGEICLELSASPAGLMTGYRDSEERTTEVMRNGRYHTGDVAFRENDGYFRYIGRTDDVFKASDYRISPFELESVLIEHEQVAEAAVVPSPDPLRLAVPKAYVTLVSGTEANADVARSILDYARERLAPYQRVRRLEFSELPKTISGKIRRVELRAAEERHGSSREGTRHEQEYWEEDFPDVSFSVLKDRACR